MNSLKALALIAALLAAPVVAEPSVPAVPAFQTGFDDLGPAVQTLAGPKARAVHFIDTGEAGWRPVLFLGGTGTSARAFLMTEYLQTLRRQLHLRFISVERNGFGDTVYGPAWTFADYVDEVSAVVDHLKVPRFAMVAISGGGPYAAHIAARMPDRLLSVHMMAALAETRNKAMDCSVPIEALAAGIAKTVGNPQSWWHMADTSPTKRIPGFADRSYDEGARAFFIRGQGGDALPEAAEMKRYCGQSLPDVSHVKAPLFTYYGEADALVVPANGAWWRAHFGGAKTERAYPGEGHDTQYRHWDQALLDMAGFGGKTLVCAGGTAAMVDPGTVVALQARGATLGLCAWRKPVP
ncbi:alpha/beta hydrolase [Sphingosinicellaceae bacterium]|nr:alpha/beta hydrolase [Sphingosinicellaceae bacterium]